MLFKATAKDWLRLDNTFSTKGLYELVSTDPELLRKFVMDLGGRDQQKQTKTLMDKIRSRIYEGSATNKDR